MISDVVAVKPLLEVGVEATVKVEVEVGVEVGVEVEVETVARSCAASLWRAAKESAIRFCLFPSVVTSKG